MGKESRDPGQECLFKEIVYGQFVIYQSCGSNLADNYRQVESNSGLGQIGTDLIDTSRLIIAETGYAIDSAKTDDILAAIADQRAATIRLTTFSNVYMGILFGVDGQVPAQTYKERVGDSVISERNRLNRVLIERMYPEDDEEDLTRDEAFALIDFTTTLERLYEEEHDLHFAGKF